MSRISNLFAAGVFIIFLAVLFHYFCRVRRKPEMIVQQQIQVPEGYVYPSKLFCEWWYLIPFKTDALKIKNIHDVFHTVTPNTNNAQHHLIIAQNYGHLHPSLINNVANMPYTVNAATPYPYNLDANNTMHLYGPGYPTSQHFSSK